MVKILILTAFAVPISIIDIVSYKIPNILLAGLYLVLIAIDLVNHSHRSLLTSLISSIALFVLFFLIFKFLRGMGFGDVKYAGVIGYALGFPKALYACLIASLIGILFFIVFHFISQQRKNLNDKRERKIPFGPFLSFGLILFSVDRLIH